MEKMDKIKKLIKEIEELFKKNKRMSAGMKAMQLIPLCKDLTPEQSAEIKPDLIRINKMVNG